jgi:hypothetical protein
MREARRVTDGVTVHDFGLQRHERKSQETNELLNNFFLEQQLFSFITPLCTKKVNLLFDKFPMKVLPLFVHHLEF